jgi:hypothetical protein
MEHERGAFKVNYEMGRAGSVKLQFALSFAFRAWHAMRATVTAVNLDSLAQLPIKRTVC